MIVKNTVTTLSGKTVSINVDFSAKPGTIGPNGHKVYTSEEEIDDFINEVVTENKVIINKKSPLELKADKLLNNK